MADAAGTADQLTQGNESLRGRLRLLENALECMNQGLCMFDAERRVSICNQRYSELLELPVEQVRPGMTLRELVQLGMEAGHYPAEMSAEEVERAIWDNFGRADELRRPLERSDRTYSVHARRTEDGNLVATFEGITVRTKTDVALRDSEARLSAIIDAMPDCVKIFAEDGTLTYINPQGLELLQASSLDELCSAGSVIPPEYLEACVEVHNRVIAGESVNWTYDLVGLKGRRVHVEANAVPFRTPDGARAHMCISRDVTARQHAEDALRRSEERLRLVHDATGLADFEAHADGYVLFSKPFVEQCGLPSGTTQLSHEDWWANVVHPDDVAPTRATIEASLTESDACQMEFRIVRPDNGEVRWISSVTKIERDARGNATRSIGAHLDITDRKRADEALRESEERFRLAAEAAGLGVWDYDPGTGKREWSGRLLEIFGFAPDIEPSLELATERVHPEDRAQLLELLYGLRDRAGTHRFTHTFRIVRANDGAERWLTMNGWKADGSEGQSRVILTSRDVTEEKTAEERIRWSASHDGLTQLANRVNFQEQLERSILGAKKAGGRVGLLMIDLDHFKQVNDALGHDAGDRLLQTFADRLQAAVRSGDTVARLGGDEFAILVPELSGEHTLAELSRSIHERLREPFIQKGRVLDCRISVGAAIYPQHGKTPKDLMISADMALYAAKAAGRSTTIEYRPELRDETQRFTSMVSTARKAIHEDRIVPFYQPQLDLANGRIVGFEALLRWRDNKNCVHLPATIEAAFEDHEVAADISDRIIEQAIGDMRLWLDEGVDFGHVAVNASAAEFRRDDFGERVLESLRKADIPPERFQLEVTETVFLGRGAEYVHRALGLLSKAGVKIALDDFGTGYASLRHLKEFPVDIIKIDKSFVRDMEDDPGDEAIIRAVVSLGKNLGIKVVAEGIENMRQAEALIALGCDYGQGFLFSKAVPGNRIPPLLAHSPGRLLREHQPPADQHIKAASGRG